MSGAHYHIRWSDLALLDFEPFTTAAEAGRWFLSDTGSSPARARIQQLRRLSVRQRSIYKG